MTVDPHHPTLHEARDLDAGWFVLHYGRTGYHMLVRSVEKLEDEIVVTFADQSTDHWRLGDLVHAAPPAPGPVGEYVHPDGSRGPRGVTQDELDASHAAYQSRPPEG
jgi:hypothetical protein